MINLKQTYQKIVNSPKALAIIGVLAFLFVIGISFFLGRQGVTIPGITPPPATPTPTITGIQLNDISPSPSLSINWNNTTVSIPDQMDIYSIKQPLINFSDSSLVAQKLGFSDENKQTPIDNSYSSWVKGDSSLVQNYTNNQLSYISGNPLGLSNKVFSDQEIYSAARTIMQSVFPNSLPQDLENQSITYFTQHNVYSVPSTPENATVIRVTFYQKINQYLATTISETGSSIVIYLDKDLHLYSLSVSNAFSTITSIRKLKTLKLADLINNENLQVQRVDTPPNTDVATDIVSAKNLNFDQSSVSVGYYSVNNQLVPVYILQGTLKTNLNKQAPGIYIILAVPTD